jgi:hypothetical protein
MPINSALNRKTAMLMRWLHIYLSMLSFAIVFFFAVTGLTLNHADRFTGQVHTTQARGHLNAAWTRGPDTLHIDKLAIVEYLRRTHDIKAAVSDLRIDDGQIGVSFKGPGYAADVFVDRASGDYELTRTSAGLVGLINDLHKGRDTGPGWSLFIDISGILLTLVSLTGIILLLFLKRRRPSGLLIAAIGLLLGWLVYIIWIK